MKILPDPADRLAVDIAHGRGTLCYGEIDNRAFPSPSYRELQSRAETLREMAAASADPADFWHYCHADNVAALAEAEKELAAIIAGHKANGKTLSPVTLEWV